MPCCTRCADYFEKLSAREGDSAEDTRRKRLFPTVMVWVLSAVALLMVTWHSEVGLDINLGGAGGHFTLVTGSVCVCCLLFTRVDTGVSIGSCMVCFAFGALCLDMQNAADMSGRVWGLVMILLDVCLLFHVPSRFTHAIISIVLVYFAVERTEANWRYGIYDAVRDSDEFPDTCSCSHPPCADGSVGVLVRRIVVFLIIVLTDFVLTRGFATGMRQQVALVETSIQVADQVAAALASFDLSTAADALAGAPLPPGLSDSLERLLHNLASYRPYLPQSCFEEGRGEEGADEDAPSTDVPRNQTPSSSLHVPARQASAESNNSSNSVGSAVLAISYATHAGPMRQASSIPDLAESRGRDGFDRCRSAVSAARAAHAPQHRKCTMLIRNSSGFLASLGEPPATASWLASQVDHFTTVVRIQKGLTDLLSGDHLSAVFGALKAQGTHRTGATRAATLLAHQRSASFAGDRQLLPVTTAVCTGSALCGDFGSSAVQRFMVIGAVGSFAAAAERCAAAWGTAVLIDSVVQADAEQTWDCRLRKRVIFPKISPCPIGLWDVTAEKATPEPGEWMYQLQNTGPNPWRAYNEVLLKWCDGDLDGALDVASDPSVGAANEGLLALQELIRQGAPPPQAPLTAAALAGQPAPTAPQQQVESSA